MHTNNKDNRDHPRVLIIKVILANTLKRVETICSRKCSQQEAVTYEHTIQFMPRVRRIFMIIHLGREKATDMEMIKTKMTMITKKRLMKTEKVLLILMGMEELLLILNNTMDITRKETRDLTRMIITMKRMRLRMKIKARHRARFTES
jgi:hypothetical protein